MREFQDEVGDGPMPPRPGAPVPPSTPHQPVPMPLSPPRAPVRGDGAGASAGAGGGGVGRMLRFVDEDPVGHGGCDTPAPLMWKRMQSGTLVVGASDLTLFVPRAGGMAKAVAVYGEIPLFGLTGSMRSIEDTQGSHIVHETGDVDTGVVIGIKELLSVMVTTAGTDTGRHMGSAFVSLCVPCGAAGVCGCSPWPGSGKKVCGQIITAPLWESCDFDVWVTQMPSGMVPAALSALDGDKTGATIVQFKGGEAQQQPESYVPRPQFYNTRIMEPVRAPRVFIGECCARTYLQEYTRRALRPVDSLPHPSMINPVFGKSTAVFRIPVHRMPHGVPTSSLASTYSTFAPCSVPRVVAVDRRSPGLPTAGLSEAKWTNMYGVSNYILILTKSVAGHPEMHRETLPARCVVRLVPMPITSSWASSSAALATPRSGAAKRVRPHIINPEDEEDEEEEEENEEQEDENVYEG